MWWKHGACDLGKESVICHLASSRLIYYITWSPIKLLLQATFAFHLYCIFSSFGQLCAYKLSHSNIVMITLELLIDASVWDHSTLLLIWEHTWLTFSFISSSHLLYHSSTSTLHLHQILHFRELLSSISPNSAAIHLLLIILHGFPSSPTPRTSIMFDPGRLLVVRVGNFNEWRVFDPGHLLLVRVGNFTKLTNELRVFDPGRLLMVRVGNLNELRVFDPGRLLVVRVGNLNE